MKIDELTVDDHLTLKNQQVYIITKLHIPIWLKLLLMVVIKHNFRFTDDDGSTSFCLLVVSNRGDLTLENIELPLFTFGDSDEHALECSTGDFLGVRTFSSS